MKLQFLKTLYIRGGIKQIEVKKKNADDVKDAMSPVLCVYQLLQTNNLYFKWVFLSSYV